MACLIEPVDKDLADTQFGAPCWATGGVFHSNSATRFWSGLVEELLRRFPAGEQFELIVCPACDLLPDMLFPGRLDVTQWEGIADEELRRQFSRTLAELEVLGEPPVVRLRVLDSTAQCVSDTNLSPECVDADLFPFLLVWLLKWAGIPESDWNNDGLSGKFEAESLPGNRRFHLGFHLATENVAEELERWVLGVQYRVE